MIYKSAILGCGPRAEIHMQAYEGVDEIRLSALCDMNRGRLDACGARYGILSRYESLEEMLDRERPDILHIVTPPAIREEPMLLAAQAGVRGIIVEKPIALDPAQAGAIRYIAERTGLKIAVNTQRRYFSTCRLLKQVLDEGLIGDIQWVRAVTKGNILSMGPHMVDLLLFFLGDISPAGVWATASGMNGHDYGHPAPADMLIRYIFPGGITAYCEDAAGAVGTIGEDDFWQHLEFDFWGSRGRAWWRQNSDWGYHAEGTAVPVVKPTSWAESDVPGQREFTRAMAAWLDGDAVHLNNLDTALQGFEAIMGAFLSAYTGHVVDLSAMVPEDIVKKLEERLER
ncbi:MAG: Gfo/Idh/MocA family oxidoreductase [bacterium]|nr:Gfo/Idh/MocA family oxidoreductase [bacterium]